MLFVHKKLEGRIPSIGKKLKHKTDDWFENDEIDSETDWTLRDANQFRC